jgi:hypothetical protein
MNDAQENGLMASVGGDVNSWMWYRPDSEKAPSMDEQPGPARNREKKKAVGARARHVAAAPQRAPLTAVEPNDEIVGGGVIQRLHVHILRAEARKRVEWERARILDQMARSRANPQTHVVVLARASRHIARVRVAQRRAKAGHRRDLHGSAGAHGEVAVRRGGVRRRTRSRDETETTAAWKARTLSPAGCAATSAATAATEAKRNMAEEIVMV